MTQVDREIKENIESQLKEYLGASWLKRLSAETDFSYEYVRKFFRSDIVQPELLNSAVEFLETVKTQRTELLKRVAP